MIIATSPKELVLIYHSDMPFAEKLLAYAAAEGLVLREIDLKKENIGAIDWEEIAGKLQVSFKDLVNYEHPDFEAKYGTHENLSEEDWLKVLLHNPEFLAHPIAIKGDKIKIIDIYSKLADF
jgi:arsenate reductase